MANGPDRIKLEKAFDVIVDNIAKSITGVFDQLLLLTWSPNV